MGPDCIHEISQWRSILHAARASHCEQARNRDFALWAAASEADLAPLNGTPKRPLGGVIGRFDAFVAQEREESFEMEQQGPGQIRDVFVVAVNIAVRKGEELLLQWNRFSDQLLA